MRGVAFTTNSHDCAGKVFICLLLEVLGHACLPRSILTVDTHKILFRQLANLHASAFLLRYCVREALDCSRCITAE